MRIVNRVSTPGFALSLRDMEKVNVRVMEI
jgi:hypothetical protein